MHASKRNKREGALRIPSAAAADVASRRPEAPALRLAVARGQLGIELERPFAFGPLTVEAVSAILPDIKFPVDLSGGVAKFRHRRGELVSLELALDTAEVGRMVAPRLRDLVGRGLPRVLVAPSAEGALVGVASDGAALAFEVILAPMGGDLRLLIDGARGVGLGGPPSIVAAKVLAAMLKSSVEAERGALVVRELARALLRDAFPALGARVPSTRSLEMRMEPPTEAGILRLVAEKGAAPPALGERTLAALEAHRLVGEGDALALDGALDAARERWVAVLERAPRHIQTALRIAAVDRLDGGRAEAALATIIEAMPAVEAGPLGAELLEATGDLDGAYDAWRESALAEPFGALAALEWLRAAEISPGDADRAYALDQALGRAPSSSAARWRRFALRVARADLKGALADAEHLEADAIGEGRFVAACRAGRELLDAGHVREARARFERALRYQPARAEGVIGLAESLRDSGQSRRATDLFARAVELAERANDADAADRARVELARLLATFGRNLPAAISRLGEVAQRGRVGCEARLYEARLRAELGDAVGASRVLRRLEGLAETMPSDGDHAPRVARILLEASTLEESLGEPARAETCLRLALRFEPSDRDIGRALRRLVGARARPVEAPRPEEQEISPEAITPEATEDPAAREAEIEDLTQKLRANPGDRGVAARLAHLLELTGRDLELLALLSARIDESADDERGELVAERDRVLGLLAAKARAEGRVSEADLYESMRGL